MATASLMSDLAPDIIFSIFACCDIASVVSVGQTCRSLHALAFEKSVWLVLLDDLRRRLIVDRNCTPNLETLSTAEIIGVVQRLTTGPQTWNPGQPDSVAEISRTIMLHPDIVPQITRWNIVKLLSSGRYVLFANTFRLECWSVADDRLIWTYISTMGDAMVHGFAAEEAHADVTIMVCITAGEGHYVEMVNLDLRTATHTSLFIARGPNPNCELYSFSNPTVCGALAAVRLVAFSSNINDQREEYYMIMNWKECLYFIVQGRASNVAIIPGHVLLSDQEHQLHLISNNTICTYGTSTVGIGGPPKFSFVLTADIPRLSTFEDVDAEQDFCEIYVHPSPIRDCDYLVWIRGTSSVAPERYALLSYRLSVPTNDEPQWCRATRSVMAPSESSMRRKSSVTYHGHCLYNNREVYTVLSAASAETVRLEPPSPPIAGKNIDLAPYSGALTYSTNSSVVIQYYK
ncbi:hypothetical protein C8R45DRAFT_366579 [Mycena sanguinolenta]|nr:hypothetical protein C8R45DRAFT_366579 [Mycena sanguinolenta]